MAKRNIEDDYEFLKIDEHHLDRHWTEQPMLFFKWSRKLADRKLEVDEAESNVDLAFAELDAEIRRNPKKYKLPEKPTEPSIKQTICNQEEYTNAVDALHRAKHAVNVTQAVVSALDHRKRALENLVDLHGQNYFAEPRTSEDGMEAKRKFEQSKAAKKYRKKKRHDNDD